MVQRECWRDATRRYNARQTIKIFWDEVNKARETPISKQQQEYIQKTLIESIGSARSINELENMLIQQGISLSRYYIEKLIVNVGLLAALISEYFDRIIAPSIRVVEADETFHGDRTMFFEAVEHNTRYVLGLKLIPDAKSNTLYPHYRDLLQRFPQISTLITDLAPAYPKTIEKLRIAYNKQLSHIKCQVHALRMIYKEIDPLKRAYSAICKRLRSLKQQLQTLQTNLKKTKKSTSYYEMKYQQLLIKRDRLQTSYNLKKHSKNILTKYPELKRLNSKINSVRSILRGKKASISNLKSKMGTCEAELLSAKKAQSRSWNLYMNHLKMKEYFVSYCKHQITTLQEFRKRLSGFKQKSCRDFKKRLLKSVQSHPELMSLHLYLEEWESFVSLISTNKIESFNNVLRRYKDIRRNWKDTELTTAYLRILRLYMNLRRPLSSKGQGYCPIEKFGIDLKGKTLYDLLFVRTEVSVFDMVNVDFELKLSGGSTLVVRD